MSKTIDWDTIPYADIRWEDIPYYVRLAAAAHVMKAICDHAKEGGSYRYLIYERLGFDLDSYAELYSAGGMDISNEFVLGGRCVSDEDQCLAKLVLDWACSILPAPSEARSKALTAAYRFRGALDELAKVDELIERRVAEAIAK